MFALTLPERLPNFCSAIRATLGQRQIRQSPGLALNAHSGNEWGKIPVLTGCSVNFHCLRDHSVEISHLQTLFHLCYYISQKMLLQGPNIDSEALNSDNCQNAALSISQLIRFNSVRSMRKASVRWH